MKYSMILAASMVTAWTTLAPMSAAHADTVLLDSIDLIQGQQAFTDTFTVASPGTLTMSLSSIPWLDSVANLNGFVSTDSGVVGTPIGIGTETFNIAAGGNVYAHWFGTAQGTYNLGVIGVRIDFQPNATAVSLPASLLLMLSGLGVLFGWQRRATPDLALG